jgi:hypothetical protein
VPRAGVDLLAEAGPAPGATRFAADSLLEEAGFEPSVPRERDRLFKFAHQMAARKAYAQRSSVIAAPSRSLIL